MKTFITRFFPYIRGHYHRFIISILAGIITALCTALITYLIKPVLDDVFINKNSTMLVILPIILVFAYFGKSAGMYIQSYLMNYIGQDIVRQIRDKLLSQILSFEMDFFNKMRSGELVSRITNDIESIRQAVSNYIGDFTRECLTLIALIFVVIYQSPKLAFFGLVIIPLAMFPVNIIAKKIKKNSKKSMEQNSDITSKLNEIFNNAELIKVSNGEKNESKYFQKVNYDFFKINMKVVQQNQLINPLMEFLGAIVIAIVIYIGGNEVIKDEMTTGAFFSFMAALFMIYTPLKKITSIYAGMQTALAAAHRIFEMLDRDSKINDGNIILNDEIQLIEFKNVSLNYNNITALKDINLEFKKNEIVALNGKSGSGKSSIVNLILRLYAPNNGKVLINNKNLAEYTQESIRNNIAIVTQKIFIFNDTIAANVAYGNKENEKEIINALKKANALDFVQNMENGIYAKLDEYGANISGGQRQRISIARAIYKNPQILIFDEATSALDEKTEDYIKNTIDLLKKDKIIILISHRPNTIELATKIVNIEDGIIQSIENKKQ